MPILLLLFCRCKNKRLCKFTVESLFKKIRLPKSCRDVNKWLKVQYLCQSKNSFLNKNQSLVRSKSDKASKTNSDSDNYFNKNKPETHLKLKPTTNGRRSGK